MLTVLAGVALAQDIHFAVIGDFGDDDENSAEVAAMVRDANPDFVLTVGDNDYSDGAYAGTFEGLELGVGQHYAMFVGDYQGEHGPGATENRFFPTAGDHDWGDTCDDPSGLDDYLAYFTLPESTSGNERYYDFRRGPVHFFALSSMEGDCEPDGSDADSVQARWVRDTAAASDAPFKVAFFHHPPWSSGDHGTDGDHMQWPWADWGFQLVMAGHDHDYERIWYDGVTSLVVGLGGVDIRGFDCAVAGSQVRYDDDYGALFVDGYADRLELVFRSVGGVEVDRFEIPLDGMPTATIADVPAEECRGCGCDTARPTAWSWARLMWRRR
ncbi:MAG: metallophosphoesterase [Alphaproteobacteria bacterium]|nr:metallophosphoesterase [Alphaproteobacteria bacterium]